MANMWRRTTSLDLMTNMGGVRPLLVFLVIFTGFAYASAHHGHAQALAEGYEVVPCEIIEVSCTPKTEFASSVHYVIIHHKNGKDRQRLSQLLKAHSGQQVLFETKDGLRHKGLLRRLNSCFGRGIVIYLDNIKLEKKDIINVYFQVDK